MMINYRDIYKKLTYFELLGYVQSETKEGKSWYINMYGRFQVHNPKRDELLNDILNWSAQLGTFKLTDDKWVLVDGVIVAQILDNYGILT